VDRNAYSSAISTQTDQAGGSKLCSEIHVLINSIWNEEELPHQWEESTIVHIYKQSDKLTIVVTE